MAISACVTSAMPESRLAHTQAEVTDDQVVTAGVSVTRNVLL